MFGLVEGLDVILQQSNNSQLQTLFGHVQGPDEILQQSNNTLLTASYRPCLAMWKALMRYSSNPHSLLATSCPLHTAPECSRNTWTQFFVTLGLAQNHTNQGRRMLMRMLLFKTKDAPSSLTTSYGACSAMCKNSTDARAPCE